MSFTFRNLFSEEDGAPGSDSESPSGERFESPESSQRGDSALSGEETGKATQSFLVSELLALIPPAISAQSGIPMEKEIAIPVSPGSGSDIALSTIYQICPELFAAEITPLNDSTITLPPKLGQAEELPVGAKPSLSAANMAAASGFESSTAPQQSATPPEDPSKDNPFWSPQSVDPTPAASGSSQGEPQPSGESSPQASGPSTAATIFGGFTDGANSDGPANPFGGAPPTESPKGDSPEPFESKIPDGFGEMTGESAENTQGSVEEAPKAETGSAEVESEPSEAFESPPAFAENPFDSSEGFTTLFSKQAQEDADIPFPGGESTDEEAVSEGWGALFHGKSEEEDSSPQQGSPPGLGEMIQESKSTEEADKNVEAAAEEMEDPLAGFGEGFQTYAPSEDSDGFNTAATDPFADFAHTTDSPGEDKDEPTTSPPEQTAEPLAGANGFSPADSMEGFSEPEPEISEDSSTEAMQPKGPASEGFQAFVPASSPGKENAKNEPKPEPEAVAPPVAEEKPAPANKVEVSVSGRADTATPSTQQVSVDMGELGSAAPLSTDRVKDGAPTDPQPSMSLPVAGEESDESLRHLELRAIFLTDESFTLAKVARRVVGIPGILGCSLATPTRIVQASKSEASRLGEEAKEMIDTIRNLAKLTGLPEAKSFTLRTDKGTVSIFLEGDYCLTVNHESDAFSPGVREQLILIARSIHKLTE